MMEALMYDPEMEMGGDWHLFGGQLQDLSVQSTFADLQGQVLQISCPRDSLSGLWYQGPDADYLEDSALNGSIDVIGYKQPSSSKVQEGRSLHDDDLYDLLSSSPEEAFLAVDEDDAVINVASTVNNDYTFVTPSYGSSSGVAEAKFDSGDIPSDQLYLNGNIFHTLSEHQEIPVEKLYDLVEADQSIRTDSFAYEYDALDVLHYENHYKPAAELDGIECANDSLLDAESVCMLLKQLVADSSDQHYTRPALYSVSPEEVESVLSNDAERKPVENYDSVYASSSSPVPIISLQPNSDDGFSSATSLDKYSQDILSSEYSQDCLSPTSSISYSLASSPGVPYSVAGRPDRKLKKKEQNKTAALRYRNKKREEKGVVYTEVEELEHRNAKLQARADDLTKEINYLKGLLEEIKKQ